MMRTGIFVMLLCAQVATYTRLLVTRIHPIDAARQPHEHIASQHLGMPIKIIYIQSQTTIPANYTINKSR